jgi:hypothetical protein
MGPRAGGLTGLSRGFVHAARRAAEILIEPADELRPDGDARTLAVVGLGPRCGCTTVARALARAVAVIEVPHGEAPERTASRADLVVLVAGPAVEPALALAVTRNLERICPKVPMVVAWGGEPGRWDGVADLVLPTAPVAARLVRAGFPAPGGLGGGLDPVFRQR